MFLKNYRKKNIKGKSKKQPLRLIELETAEKKIKGEAELDKDVEMLIAVRGTKSLRASEFMMHDRCYLDYTWVVPAVTKFSVGNR